MKSHLRQQPKAPRIVVPLSLKTTLKKTHWLKLQLQNNFKIYNDVIRIMHFKYLAAGCICAAAFSQHQG
jgi:hypothetical protein